MDGDFNPLALRLISAVVGDHPDWRRHVAPYGPADDAEAEPGSVIFSIPAREDPAHRLEIAQRGNSVEVAYDCGAIGVRAEQLFIVDDESVDQMLAALQVFLRDLEAGGVVVVRAPLGRIVRALRRDGVAELASFRAALASEPLGPGETLHRWCKA